MVATASAEPPAGPPYEFPATAVTAVEAMSANPGGSSRRNVRHRDGCCGEKASRRHQRDTATSSATAARTTTSISECWHELSNQCVRKRCTFSMAAGADGVQE